MFTLKKPKEKLVKLSTAPFPINDKSKKLNSNNLILKAQIHAGGRGKAGGVKIVKDIEELKREAKALLGKTLITTQTGSSGKEVKSLYIEEASEIMKEFYLSCIIDRESSKIAFISSSEGGMSIEEVAIQNPKKIVTTRVEFSDEIKKNVNGNLNKLSKVLLALIALLLCSVSSRVSKI